MTALLLLLGLSFSSPAVGESPVPPLVERQFAVEVRTPGSVPPHGSVWLHPESHPGLEPVELPVDGKAVRRSVSLPLGSRWMVSADIPGYWIPEGLLEISERPVVRFRLWPTGIVKGALRALEERALPSSLQVRLESPRANAAPREIGGGEFDCPIEPDGRFRCALPVAVLDLAVRVPGYIPFYRWDVSVRLDREADLGRMPLEVGASVVGWVVTENREPLPEQVGVRLVSKLAAGNEAALAEKLQILGEQKELDAEGFFQFLGLAPGSYTVVATAGTDARAMSQPFEVWEGEETLLREPLVLREPLTLEVVVEPPVDFRGEPWEVAVSRAADDSGRFDRPPIFLGETREGRVSLPNQFPGMFSLRVGNREGGVYFSESAWVVQSEFDASQRVEMEVHRVSGTVTLGDEPLDATVWFGGRYGELRIPLRSLGEDGYSGVVPVQDVWNVEIEADELGARLERRVRLDDDDEHVVDFELPNTEVHGRVAAGDGTPVAGAAVLVSDQGEGASTSTDEAGEFVLRGFEAGDIRIHAMVPARHSRASEVVTLSVVEDAPLGPVVLTLVENRRFQGTVLTRGRPVVGALVHARPFPAGAPSTVRTGVDGRFVLHLREDTTSAQVVVSPPIGALTTADLMFVDGVEAVVEVAPAGGTVVLLVEGVKLGQAQLDFSQDGRRLDISTLWSWLDGRGRSREMLERDGDLIFPDLAPGDYLACLGGRFDRDATPRCESGSLAQGGTLTLDLRPPS